MDTYTQHDLGASTSYDRGAKRGGQPPSATVARTPRGSDDGDEYYDLTLVNGRTGGGLPEGTDDASRAAIAERRLFETQQVLVQERLAREISEAILSETAKALSAVRRAAAEGGRAATTGVPLQGGREEAQQLLSSKLNLLRLDYDTLRAEALQKDKAIENLKREVRQLEEGYVETERPVTMNIDIRQMTTTDQDELVMASKVLLDRAQQLERCVDELREVDEQRIRTIAEVFSSMEARQSELKDKLRDAGLLDEEDYDDDKVGELGREGLMGDKEQFGHMAAVEVNYDGPATSPLGKNFYATRTVSWWDRWFGTHC